MPTSSLQCILGSPWSVTAFQYELSLKATWFYRQLLCCWLGTALCCVGWLFSLRACFSWAFYHRRTVFGVSGERGVPVCCGKQRSGLLAVCGRSLKKFKPSLSEKTVRMSHTRQMFDRQSTLSGRRGAEEGVSLKNRQLRVHIQSILYVISVRERERGRAARRW